MKVEKASRRQRARTIRTLVTIIAIITALVLICVLILIISSIPKSDNPKTDNEQKEESTSAQTIDINGKVKFTEVSVASSNVGIGELVLVNSSLKYQFSEDNSKLLPINENRTTKNYVAVLNTTKLHTSALAKADEMLNACCAATGKDTLMINSAYRTYEEQESLDSEIKAGYSDSHTGYGFSLRFTDSAKLTSDTEVYSWLKNNCYKYGFVIRYPDGKENITGVNDYSYYFRYVGFVHAYYMTHSEAATTENPLTLEEYTNIVKGYTDSNRLSITADDGHTYEVYYVAASSSSETTIKVPSNREYTISGNNDGGFVVTVTLS